MIITDQAEADEYFEALVERSMRSGVRRDEAIRVEKINLGYFAGYCGYETMKRVNRLFRTTHPIFGDVAPTAEEAFRKGYEIGRNNAKV